MTVKEIVEKALREGGYDGLCKPDLECGCAVNPKDGGASLFECDNCDGSCEPGYFWVCKTCPVGKSEDGCDFYDEQHGRCIRAEKPIS